MKNFFKKAFLPIIVLLIVGSINFSNAAQDSKGTDFWLMFDRNFDNSGVSLTLFITSDVNTSGVVSGPSFVAIPFNVTANTITTVVVPVALATHTSDVVDNKGIHVTSLQEVTVYGLNRAPFTTDAYLGLPTDILGTDYNIITFNNSFATANNNTQFGIVGTVNGTTVTITPSVTIGPRTAGVPYNIVLNQGETYELRSLNLAAADLTGTKITSTQPIGVMGTHSCANIPTGQVFCDHICEMIPPTTTWGKNFLAVPLRSRANGDTWRFMASQNSTTISINGVPQPAINSGQFINTNLTADAVISSDKPILAAQYSNGSGFSGNPGDPFIMLIPPTEQFLANYTLINLTGFVNNFINIVCPNSIVGSLTLDGVPVPVVEFTPIAGSAGYSRAQVPVTSSSHTLAGTLPFGVYDYGFNQDDSYGYPGGLNLAPVATVTSLDVSPEFDVNPINSQHCLDGLVLDQNNQPVTGIRVDFLISGANPGAGFAFTGANGIAQFCYVGTHPGLDTIIGSTGNLSDTVFKQWTAVLPVELASFTSVVNKKNVTLNWTTAEEVNNSGFDLERKISSATDWTKITFVQGNGTTNEPKNYSFVDKNVNAGNYSYRLKQIDYNGAYRYFNLSNDVTIGNPDKFVLLQNYPNPFNPTTSIDFELPKEGNVVLSVFDNSGRLVSTLINEFKTAGYYSAKFNASNLASGIYFYKLEINGFSKVMKMSLIK